VHPAPGTHIVRFEKLDEGVYKGSKPKTDADYEFLQSLGVKYIAVLKFFPLHHVGERRHAKKYGMTLIPLDMNASPVAPTEKHINRILCLLRDQRYRPIYFHCDLGRDRSALIAALYGMYYRGTSKHEAWEDMQRNGFKGGWGLRGLTDYFEGHSEPPVEKYIPKCSATAPKNSEETSVPKPEHKQH